MCILNGCYSLGERLIVPLPNRETVVDNVSVCLSACIMCIMYVHVGWGNAVQQNVTDSFCSVFPKSSRQRGRGSEEVSESRLPS